VTPASGGSMNTEDNGTRMTRMKHGFARINQQIISLLDPRESVFHPRHPCAIAF
jgi:hypothetical protein